MTAKFRQLPDESEDIRRNTDTHCSDQRSLLKLLNAVGKSGWWQGVARKEHQDVKEAISAKKYAFKTLLQNRSSSDLQS